MSYKKDSILGRRGIERLIKWAITSKTEALYPELDEKGHYYPVVEEILNTDRVDALNVLETLSNMGALERQLIESTITCPSCGSMYFALKLVCPTCSSGRLLKGDVIEHLICGYVDFEQEFYKERFECPKCKKELKALGVDYRRAGTFYKCIPCGRVTAIAVKRYVCGKCMRTSSEEELTLKPIYRYVIVHDKLASLFETYVDLSPIITYLESKGFEVKNPAHITGASGVTHEFTLYVNKQGRRPSTGVVADLVNEADEQKVYELFTKSFDVKAGSSLLFIIGRVDEKTFKLSKTFNISVYEVQSIDDLLEVAKNALETKLNELSKKEAAREIEFLEKIIQDLDKYYFK